VLWLRWGVWAPRLLTVSRRRDIPRWRSGRAQRQMRSRSGVGRSRRRERRTTSSAASPDLHQQRLASHDDGLFPVGKNTGAAVVVFPGGGYQILVGSVSYSMPFRDTNDFQITKLTKAILSFIPQRNHGIDFRSPAASALSRSYPCLLVKNDPLAVFANRPGLGVILREPG
jgi:hypothetical protein